jgi:type IV pilus assembly protein PilE
MYSLLAVEVTSFRGVRIGGRCQMRGFTLIEVMIVVALIGILSAIAFPSYLDSIARGRRAEARTALTEAAQFMARFYAVNDSYSVDRAGNAVAIPASLAQSPRSGAPVYLISLVPADLSPTGFVVQAVPVISDKCGSFLLNQSGQRSLQGGASNANVKDCWR